MTDTTTTTTTARSADTWVAPWNKDPIYLALVPIVEALWALGEDGAHIYQDGTSGGLIHVRVPTTDARGEWDPMLCVSTEDYDAERRTWHGQHVAWTEDDCLAGDLLPVVRTGQDTALDLDDYGSERGLSPEDVARAIADLAAGIRAGNVD